MLHHVKMNQLNPAQMSDSENRGLHGLEFQQGGMIVLLWETEKREELFPAMVEPRRVKGWFYEPGWVSITSQLGRSRPVH